MNKVKKLLTIILSLSLFFSTLPVQAMNPAELESALKSDARLAFEKLTSTLYEEADQVEVMVELDESKFRQFGKNYTGAELREELLIPLQIEFSKNVNQFVLGDLEQRGIGYDLYHAYEILFLGFAAKVSYADALAIADLEYVKSVNPVVKYDRPEYSFFDQEVQMIHSHEIVNQHLVNSQYKGEGTVVAVIDSGFDFDHPAFYISDEFKSKVKLTRNQVEALVNKKEVAAGVYLSEKFPFGYNYEQDNATTIKEAKVESHGQHVAGTVGANIVNMPQGKFMGIAPETQILALRVFPEGGGTSDNIYVRAMEDAIKLGADSMNLSLGSSAGNLKDGSEALEQAMDKAADMGIVVAIAAGNDGQFGRSVANPKASEPDYGIMSYPALTPRSLSVASYNNTKIMQNYIVLTKDGGESEEVGFVQPGDSRIQFGEDTLKIVNGGIGLPDQIPDDANGKYVLIERGKITFTEKINNAAAKGAAGAIIYNHAIGGNDFIGMSAAGAKIAAASIRRDTALKILAEIDKYSAKFSRELKAFDSKTAGYISDFSNWGLASDGDIKPEILAPGGNIYSTLANKTYGNMSGTSMATPHVAGGIVLVKSRVNADFPNYSGYEKYELVKNLLMSTATPHTNLDENVFSSPRNQGSGIMNLQGAVTSHVILVDRKTRVSKINLGDIEETFNFKVTVKNLKDQPATYRYKTYVLTDKVVGDYMSLNPRLLTVVEGDEITVGANEELDVKVEVDTSEYTVELTKKMPNGYFLEGYVVFENVDEANPQPNLSIPFVGFKGNFGGLDVVEPSVYELAEQGRLPRYYQYNADGSFEKRDFTHFWSTVNGKEIILGQASEFNPQRPQFDKLVISPNGDGKLDSVGFTYTMLRNGSLLRAKLYAADDKDLANSLGTLFEETSTFALRKNFFSGDTKRPKSNTLSRNITLFNNPSVVDGTYQVVMESKSIIDTAPVNQNVLEFVVDRTAPAVTELAFDQDSRLLTFQVEDATSGLKEVTVKFSENGKTYFLRKGENGYRIPQGVSLKNVTITASDYGYNSNEVNVDEVLSGVEFGSLTTVSAVVPIGSSAPNFTERIVSADDETVVWNKNRLVEGKYKLYIENVPYSYRLLTPMPIEFEITATEKHVRKAVSFEKLELRTIAVQLPNNLSGIVQVIVKNTTNNLSLIVPPYGPNPQYAVGALPYGRYQILFDKVPQGIKMSVEGLTNNMFELNAASDELMIFRTKVMLDDRRPLTITTTGLGVGETAEYEIYSPVTKKLENATDSLVRGVYILIPKTYPQRYRPTKSFEVIRVNEADTRVDVTFAFESGTDGQADVTVTDNKDDFGLTPEYLLVDAKGYLGLTGGITYALKDNPKVPFGRYILTANKDSYDKTEYEVDEKEVLIDQDDTVLTAKWISKIASSDLSLQVELPEELSEVALQFIDQKQKVTDVTYNKDVLATQVVSLKHGQYDVEVKDLAEGYVVKEKNLAFEHNGTGVLRLTIVKAKVGNEPEEYGFGKLIVEVRDQDDNLVGDVEAKVYHNDAEVDVTTILPYGNYDVRITKFDDQKYTVLEDNKEVVLSAENRVETVVLRVKAPVDKTALAEAIDKAAQIDLGKYSEETANALRLALASARKVYANDDAKQSEVNAEIAALDKAMQGLKDKPAPTPDYTPSPSTPRGEQYNPSKPAPTKESEIKDNKLPLGDAGFTDVKTNDWFATPVAYVKAKGLMKGVSATEFKPNMAVTRGMVVTILHRLENTPVSSKETSIFTDVKANAYYADAVKWASSEKLILGFGNGLFRPEEEITREQLAHILAKYAAFKNKKTEAKTEITFTDKALVSDYAKESVTWANEAGLLTGKENNLLDPQGKATRAQLAKVLQNLIEKILEGK